MTEPAAEPSRGIRPGLTDYGDAGFSPFLRKPYTKGAGYADDALDRPVIGIINTGSGFNACQGNMPHQRVFRPSRW